jgi:hypothetical protein
VQAIGEHLKIMHVNWVAEDPLSPHGHLTTAASLEQHPANCKIAKAFLLWLACIELSCTCTTLLNMHNTSCMHACMTLCLSPTRHLKILGVATTCQRGHGSNASTYPVRPARGCCPAALRVHFECIYRQRRSCFLKTRPQLETNLTLVDTDD